MKKTVSLILCIIMVLGLFGVVTAPAASEIKIILNEEQLEFDVPPIIIDGRTLVPFRAIFEKLNAEVDWEPDSRTVTAEKGDILIRLKIDNDIAFVNDDEVILEVPTQIFDDRTLVPLRFISETLGFDVNWNGDNNLITIKGSIDPTPLPTDKPTASPVPTATPTAIPTQTPNPTASPTATPTFAPWEVFTFNNLKLVVFGEFVDCDIIHGSYLDEFNSYIDAHNIAINLSAFANAFRTTTFQFDFTYDESKDILSITTGKPYHGTVDSKSGYNGETSIHISPVGNLFFDEQSVQNFGFSKLLPDNILFISPAILCQILGAEISLERDSKTVYIDVLGTNRKF